MENLSAQQAGWLEKERGKIEPAKKRKTKRRYLHFDTRIKKIAPDLTAKVFDPTYVASHNFHPFIRDVQKKKRYKRQPPGSPHRTRIEVKERPIDYSAHKDALILSWYAFQLSLKYESILIQSRLSENVIAYRPIGKSTYDHVKQVIDFVKSHPGHVAIALDVEKFFQKIDHAHLKDAWCSVLEQNRLPKDHYNIYRYVTDYRFAELWLLQKHLGFTRKDHRGMARICEPNDFRSKVVQAGLLKRNPLKTAGIPQGSSISCVLSNIYMLLFDRQVAERIESLGGLYLRYSDDILCIVPKANVQEICDFASRVLRGDLKLDINPEKTELTSFDDMHGFLQAQDLDTGNNTHLSYLGIAFDGRRSHLRHKTVARHQRRMRAGIKRNVKQAYQRGTLPRKRYPEYMRTGGPNTWTYADRVADALDSDAIRKQTSDKRMARQIKSKVKRYETKQK